MSPKLFEYHSSIHNVFPPKVDYDLRLDEHDLSLSKEFFWSTKLILFMYRIAPIVSTSTTIQV